MNWLTLPSLLLLLVTLCWSSDQDDADDIVQIMYPKATIHAARGSSVKLSCDAHYSYKQCGVLDVLWYQESTELKEPKKYLTTVNETVSDGDKRRRQVVTEILDLAPEDNGRFQCKAECESGSAAMGHFILITVEG